MHSSTFQAHDVLRRAVFIGRLLPAVRTFISRPTGYAHMRPVRFGIYMTVGSVPWIGGLAWSGYAPGLTGSMCSIW